MPVSVHLLCLEANRRKALFWAFCDVWHGRAGDVQSYVSGIIVPLMKPSSDPVARALQEHVEIVAYDPVWPQRFEALEQWLRDNDTELEGRRNGT